MLDLLRDLFFIGYLIANPWALLILGFQIWMFIDAIRRKEWIWALFIFIGFGF